MPTALDPLSAAWAPVASGPSTAYVTFQDDNGFFTVHSSVDPAAIVTGHPYPKGVTFEVALATGEHLHLRGRGTATVSAATLV